MRRERKRRSPCCCAGHSIPRRKIGLPATILQVLCGNVGRKCGGQVPRSCTWSGPEIWIQMKCILARTRANTLNANPRSNPALPRTARLSVNTIWGTHLGTPARRVRTWRSSGSRNKRRPGNLRQARQSARALVRLEPSQWVPPGVCICWREPKPKGKPLV